MELIRRIENLCIKLNFHYIYPSNQIVLLRLDALGDFVLWQDAAKEFKKKYPKSKITVVCQKPIDEFARSFPYFDEVCSLDIKRIQKSLKYFIYIFLKMQRYRGATLIQAVYSRTWLMDVIAAMIPAHKKITVDGNHDNFYNEEKKNDGIYDIVRHINSQWDLELRRNAMFMRSLGFKEFRSAIPELPEYSLGNKKIQGEYFVIVLGAGNPAREWRPEYYGIVAKFIKCQYSLKCCLLGVEQDKSLTKIFNETFHFPCIDLIGKTSISEYIQIVREAKLIVSGDTSAVHIAAAVRTHSVVIGGGWHYGRFLPYHTETKNDRKYFPNLCCQQMDCYQCNRQRVTRQCRNDERRSGKWSCILAVTPDMVIKKVKQVL